MQQGTRASSAAPGTGEHIGPCGDIKYLRLEYEPRETAMDCFPPGLSPSKVGRAEPAYSTGWRGIPPKRHRRSREGGQPASTGKREAGRHGDTACIQGTAVPLH